MAQLAPAASQPQEHGRVFRLAVPQAFKMLEGRAGRASNQKRLGQAKPCRVVFGIQFHSLAIIRYGTAEMKELLPDPAAPEQGLDIVWLALQKNIQGAECLGQAITADVVLNQDFEDQRRFWVVLFDTPPQEAIYGWVAALGPHQSAL